MNTNFDKSLGYILESEGGFSDNSKDPGGATNHGVTLRTWEDWQRRTVSVQEIKDLTVDQITPLYKSKYWDSIKADVLPSGVDYLMFDAAVNCGVSNSIKFLQRALKVNADGLLGPSTLTALRDVAVADVIDQFTSVKEEHYQDLPDFDVFGKGWMNRSEKVKEQALALS